VDFLSIEVTKAVEHHQVLGKTSCLGDGPLTTT